MPRDQKHEELRYVSRIIDTCIIIFATSVTVWAHLDSCHKLPWTYTGIFTADFDRSSWCWHPHLWRVFVPGCTGMHWILLATYILNCSQRFHSQHILWPLPHPLPVYFTFSFLLSLFYPPTILNFASCFQVSSPHVPPTMFFVLPAHTFNFQFVLWCTMIVIIFILKIQNKYRIQEHLMPSLFSPT